MILPIVSAANETVNNTLNVSVTPSMFQGLPEEFYGDVKYSDGTLVSSGSQIQALNQQGTIIGIFNMTYNGSYGDSYRTAPRLIVTAETDDDIITFYVNNIKSSKTIKFDSGSIKRADIIVPLSSKPVITPTTVPTVEITPTPTESIIITTIPTPVPTTIITTIPTTIPTPTQTPKLVPAIASPSVMKFAGVLFIALGICLFGAVLTYFILTRKMKREDEEEINL